MTLIRWPWLCDKEWKIENYIFSPFTNGKSHYIPRSTTTQIHIILYGQSHLHLQLTVFSGSVGKERKKMHFIKNNNHFRYVQVNFNLRCSSLSVEYCYGAIWRWQSANSVSFKSMVIGWWKNPNEMPTNETCLHFMQQIKHQQWPT